MKRNEIASDWWSLIAFSQQQFVVFEIGSGRKERKQKSEKSILFLCSP